jgi:hypothetical protein
MGIRHHEQGPASPSKGFFLLSITHPLFFYVVCAYFTLNEPATTGRIVDRVEVKLDLTTDQ